MLGEIKQEIIKYGDFISQNLLTASIKDTQSSADFMVASMSVYSKLIVPVALELSADSHILPMEDIKRKVSQYHMANSYDLKSIVTVNNSEQVSTYLSGLVHTNKTVGTAWLHRLFMQP